MPKIKLNLLPRFQTCLLAALPVLVLPVVLSSCSAQPLLEDAESSPPEHGVVIEQGTKVLTPLKSETTADADDAGVVSPAPVQVKSKLDADSLFNLLVAEFAGNIGDIETSLEHYQLALKSIEDSRIAARAAYIALYGGEYDAALVALARWRELEPNANDLPRMYALVWLKLGQPEKAVPYIQVLLTKADANEADEAMAVKKLLAKEASTADAYVVLKKLNAGAGQNIHLLVLQSRYAAQLKKYDESLAILDRVLEIEPTMHEVLIIKAKILFSQGKHEEASVLIKQVLIDFPESIFLRRQYARMLVEQSDLKAAAEQYSILHEKLPDDVEIALSLALLHIETNNLDAAVVALKYLLEIDKKTAIANYYLARIAQSRGNKKQAIAYYQQVNTGDYVFDSQLRIGILLSIGGQPEEGLAKLEALGEKHTDWNIRVRAYLAQGEVLRTLHRYEEAVQVFSRGLQHNHLDVSLLYARALMAVKIDRLDITEADLLKVIALEPDNADALNALGYTLADRTTRHHEALAYIKRAIELKPNDPAILDSLGWVNYRLGNMDEALKWLSKAFSKLKDAEIAAHYGEVLWYSGQQDKAREIWRKGKAIDAEHPVLIETLERIRP